MIPKNFTLQAPLDNQISYLDKFLSSVSRDGLKSLSGSYTGDGTTSKTVVIGFTPILLLIWEYIDMARTTSYPVTKDIVFTPYSNIGVSYIPGTGFVKDAVTGYSNGSISLGVNTNVNAAGTSYLFLAIG